jgi:hypothetical protein
MSMPAALFGQLLVFRRLAIDRDRDRDRVMATATARSPV